VKTINTSERTIHGKKKLYKRLLFCYH